MGNDGKVWLADIQRSITEIYGFLPEEKSFAAFRQDLKAKKAVERNLEIIGEALNRLLKINPQLPVTNARQIVNTRNRIIHGYDTVSEDIIWAIVTRELPRLEEEINRLLE